MRRGQVVAVGLLAVATMVVTELPAFAADGNLPGGTTISVNVTAPAEDTVIPLGPAHVTGTASVGTGVPVKDTALTYVVDVSGSTASACGNGNTVLGCETLAARTLNNRAAAADSVIGSVGAVVFGSQAATADVQPAGGDQLLTGPATDDNGNGTPDINEVLASAVIGGVGQFTAKNFASGTDYVAGINSATTVTDAQTQHRKIVVFLSDGLQSNDVRAVAGAQVGKATYFTFAVGADATCSGTNYNASLQAIADLTGGTCTQVSNPADLPNILPGLISSQLTDLTLTVDGGGATPVTNVTPGLPRTGPASVSYSVDTGALTPGRHELCVTAKGTDGGGPGSVVDCTHVIVNAPPVVDVGGPYAGQEGSAVQIAGTVTDPDGPPGTRHWTATPVSGVDAGASCAFGDASAVTTTITCTDDGVWNLTLTANDTINPPVSKTTTLTLTNVAPQVRITAPTNGALVLRNASVGVTAPFTDVGTNDKHTCTVDFADGTPVATGTVTETPGSGTCSASHTYAGVGAHNVLVTVTDDDGGSATAIVKVVSYVNAEAWALSASGLITVAKTPHAVCPPNSNITTATVTVLGLATVQALHGDCTLDANTGRTVANASVSGASLLGGAISLTDIQSQCVVNEQGQSGSSRVGTLNGRPIGTVPAEVTLAGLATVYLNQTVVGPNGQFAQYAVHVVTLLGQDIVLAGCRTGI